MAAPPPTSAEDAECDERRHPHGGAAFGVGRARAHTGTRTRARARARAHTHTRGGAMGGGRAHARSIIQYACRCSVLRCKGPGAVVWWRRLYTWSHLHMRAAPPPPRRAGH